jgi:superfamily II DNA or RNA helicase
MSYFSDNYAHLAFPVATNGERGLYNAQLGAIHSIAAHFTIYEEPAIVTMPTGSGKTAVLMMVPFLLQSSRVLVVTPSVMVRDQIREDFAKLETLVSIGVVPSGFSPPKVYEVRERISTVELWEDLRQYDVVIGTPNCTSPAYEQIPPPPPDLFDLVLIDEAHHSTAETWTHLSEAFPKHAKRVLFTATPFRRDKAEIKGRFIYSYPIAKAYADKIFGKIEYIAANLEGELSENDVAVATKAQQVLVQDRQGGFNHFLMVRTDQRKRADELAKIYETHTALRLEIIHSGHSNKRAKKAIELLSAGELDGIICVNMLGEGFNFPRLKIAAIHAPHKSLEVTLQFIGRFARTNAPDIGAAKFIAAPNDIEIEGKRLFAEGAIWNELIVGMNQGRIAKEINVRQTLQEFDDPEAGDIEIKDLSLYALAPRSHVKIYEIAPEVDIDKEFSRSLPFRVVYRNVNRTANAALVITEQMTRPRWSYGDQFLDLAYDLIVVYIDRPTNLLFINSSRSIEGLYAAIAKGFDPTARPLAISQTNRVVRDLQNRRFFNIGMRNIRTTNNAESYRIITGSNTQAAVKPSDGRIYRQGHVFLAGESHGQKVTIGYSSGSKVWSSSTLQLPDLLSWCSELAAQIRSTGEIHTNSGLDYLSTGIIATQLPSDVVYAQWDKDAFDYTNPVTIVYRDDNGNEVRSHISELDVVIDHANCTSQRLCVNITGPTIEYPISFTISEFFASPENDNDRIRVNKREGQCSLVDYLNENFIDFYTADGSLLRGNELFVAAENPQVIDVGQIEAIDWTGADIVRETGQANGSGSSIHTFMGELLNKDTISEIIFYDHGAGEIADFVTISRTDHTVVVRLFHCKGSGGRRAGARVDDLYEVCGQAQKSIVWTNSQERLYKKMLSRAVRSRFLRGTIDGVKEMLMNTPQLRKKFEIVLVQPGVAKAQISQGMLQTLGATSDHLRSGGCEPLRLWASA